MGRRAVRAGVAGDDDREAERVLAAERVEEETNVGLEHGLLVVDRDDDLDELESGLRKCCDSDTAAVDVRFVASFSVVSAHQADDRRLFVDGLGLPLGPPETQPDSDYVFSEQLDGARHFGVWPLAEAAESCFGRKEWPSTHPVPQASVEFEVDDVEAAARELEEKGFTLLHPTRTEPWGQVIARVQTPDGVIVGVCYTPWLRDQD